MNPEPNGHYHFPPFIEIFNCDNNKCRKMQEFALESIVWSNTHFLCICVIERD